MDWFGPRPGVPVLVRSRVARVQLFYISCQSSSIGVHNYVVDVYTTLLVIIYRVCGIGEWTASDCQRD